MSIGDHWARFFLEERASFAERAAERRLANLKFETSEDKRELLVKFMNQACDLAAAHAREEVLRAAIEELMPGLLQELDPALNDHGDEAYQEAMNEFRARADEFQTWLYE